MKVKRYDPQPQQGYNLSVCAAAFNEAQNLPELVGEIAQSVGKLPGLWEIVIGNDASEDDSLEVLRRLREQTPQLRFVTLRKRSGQSAALEAALRHSRGRYVATLDADLQNDPADIPRMLELIRKNECDFVNGWRKNRNDPWIRLVSTRIANGVRNWLTSENIHDSACGLKIFKRECLANVKLFTGAHRFLPTLVKLEGYQVKEIPVNHRARTAGVAKYGISNRVFKALRDAFAVRWMQHRYMRYELDESLCSNGVDDGPTS